MMVDNQHFTADHPKRGRSWPALHARLLLSTRLFFNSNACGLALVAGLWVGGVAQETVATPAGGSSITRPFSPEEITKARRRQYPGGADEEELKVQESLPEATRKVTERMIQSQVLKQYFNQEITEEAPDEDVRPQSED